MKIKVNGKEQNLEKAMSLLEFLGESKIDINIVVVEYNYDIIEKEKWKDITLTDGDNLEILQLVGGG